MLKSMFFHRSEPHFFTKVLAIVVATAMISVQGFAVLPAMAVVGGEIQTPVQPTELPVEIEVETGPASLKQAPLWKELIQLLEEPFEPVERRPGFGVAMPPLEVWPLDYNFLTGQPMWLRTDNGEVSWDQPGALFDPDEVVPVDAFNVPTALRTVIGELIVEIDGVGGFSDPNCHAPYGCLVVDNPGGDVRIPPDGTVIAVPAFFDGVLHEWDPDLDVLVELEELEIPINEEDFLTGDTREEKNAAREAAEVLGKALFWDMQVGSDGVQACASCHFHAGVDNRSRNQLNPNHLGGDNTLQVSTPDGEVLPGDFPFHKLVDPSIPGEPLLNPGNVMSDANDVMSSMGVTFRTFVDIPTPGPGAFIPGTSPPVLKPDIGVADPDPLGAVFQGLRRVEPRNTPTFHGAAFNLDNFWDGRARFHFNGGSVQGPSDPQFHVFVDDGLGGGLVPASNGYYRDELLVEDPEIAAQPVRIKFSSLASQAVGPPLSNFEMSFDGRNWAKIAKKLLQSDVVPLANQLVALDDSVLGPYSNQHIALGMPGLSISYPELIMLAFSGDLWSNTTQHLAGATVPLGSQPPVGDPFDGYQLSIAAGPASAADTNQFTQMEANFSLIFGLAVQMYEELTIPDDTAFDKFMDANPLAANGIGQAGEQGVLFPTLIRDLVGGFLTLIPDDPSTPHYDGFGPDELFGWDIFAGGNLTAALTAGQAVDPVSGVNRNPDGFGSNPFSRTARCMQCHLGPEQTDHSFNISHGIIKGDAEFEWPSPPSVVDPFGATVPAPEPPGPIKTVGGLILAEELEGAAQDAVEVEPRNFATIDDPGTPHDDRIIAAPSFFAFGDQGVYNVGLRPAAEDAGRGDFDPFSWPLSKAALALMNIAGDDGVECAAGGPCFDPPDDPSDAPALMSNFDPEDIGNELATPGQQGFEETGDGEFFAGTTYTLQSINPGFERTPVTPLLPEYLAPWAHDLPAGELHPLIDEQAGLLPNTITPPNGGPAIEFSENLFGTDLHCGVYDPLSFGLMSPNFGWGPLCPNNQSGVPSNLDYPIHGTWPFANRVLRNAAFKAPPLRNVEMSGPFFHTGSYLTLRQVVDFYIRGGDFPVTNAEGRDPHMLDVVNQAFGFGSTRIASNGGPIPDVPFADALPDTQYQYDPMPDTDHPQTPEPATSTVEEAKTALVRLLLAFTDQRVKYARAPFDYPELFVPISGAAPDNTSGRAALLADASFLHLPPVGAGGLAEPLANFLDVASVPSPGPDHFDVVTSAQALAVDDTYSAVATIPLNVAAPGVLGNDSDPEGDPLTAVLLSGPTDPNGSLTLYGDGSFTYTYGMNISSPVIDTFTYAANDGLADSMPATVAITVNPPMLTVLDPSDPGISVFSGHKYTINWLAAPDVVSFDLYYSLDNGASWSPIAIGVAGNSYFWKPLPIVARNERDSLVGIIGYRADGSRAGRDASDNPFTIQVVRVDSPMAGDMWPGGSSQTISWTTGRTVAPVAETQVIFSINGGASWQSLATLAGNPGTYNLTLPALGRSYVRTKVGVILKDAAGSTIGFDASNGVFSLIAGP